MDEKKLMLIQWGVGLVIAIVFILSGLGSVFNANDFEKNAVEVQAVVSQVNNRLETNSKGASSRVYTPYVDYEFNGMVYRKATLTGRTIEPKVGDQITILVNPGNPAQIMEPKSGFNFGFAKLGFGILLGVIMLGKLKETKDQY